MTRDVGLMGEREFEQWCAQAGLIANRADVDKGGWDFLVQTPLATRSEVESLDHLPFTPTFWVQVKSSDDERAPSVKLSNWKRLIEPSLPSFHLVLRYSGQEHPREAFVVPVDEMATKAVLKKLRSLPVEEGSKLHKHHLLVNVLPEHRLPACNGASLLEALKRHVGPSMKVYRDQKQRWVDGAGYDGGRFRISMTTRAASPGQSADDHLVEFAIGLIPELPSTIQQVQEIRFGVARPAPFSFSVPREALLSVDDLPALTGSVEVAVEDGTRRVRLPCRFYHPWNIFPFIAKDRLRFRVATEPFDLIFAENRTAVTLRIHLPSETDAPKSLAEWVSAFGVAEMVQDRAVPLIVTLDVGGRKLTTRFESGRPFELSDYDRGVMEAVLNADKAARALPIDTSLPVTPSELLGASEDLATAALILTSDLGTVTIRGEVDSPGPDRSRAGCPILVAAPIGRTVYIVGLAYFGTMQYAPESEGRRPFTLAALERKVVFVEALPFGPDISYPASPFLDRLRSWLRAQDVELLPSPSEAE